MPVDTSIYANLLRPPKSVEDYMKDDQAIQGNALLNALRGTQVQNALRAQQDETRYRDVASGFGADTQANALSLRKAGLPDQADNYLKSQGELQTRQIQNDEAMWELALAKQKRITELAAGAKDQASWSMARNAAAHLGADVSQIPEQFSPELAAHFANLSLTQLQRLDQERNARLDAEAARHNREAEKSAARSHALREREFAYRQENDREDRALRRDLKGFGQGSSGPAPKPMPAAALKLQQEELDAIGAAGGIDADLGELERKLSDGDLELGPWENLKSKGRNSVGLSDKNSQAYASFIATLEKLRNDSLRLNKGVQTEGDAVRAWNELISNVNDQGVVKTRLAEIRRLNQRASDLRRLNVDHIRSNYGHESIDTTPYRNQQPANRPTNRPGLDQFSGDKSKRPPLSDFQR